MSACCGAVVRNECRDHFSKTNGPPRHCHLVPLETRHISLATCQHPHNYQITQTLLHHILTSFSDFGGKLFFL
jgi:hypothetical protein